MRNEKSNGIHISKIGAGEDEDVIPTFLFAKNFQPLLASIHRNPASRFNNKMKSQERVCEIQLNNRKKTQAEISLKAIC